MHVLYEKRIEVWPVTGVGLLFETMLSDLDWLSINWARPFCSVEYSIRIFLCSLIQFFYQQLSKSIFDPNIWS